MPSPMRQFRLAALILACAAWTTRCASTGAVPAPFPRPGTPAVPAATAPADPAEPQPDGGEPAVPAERPITASADPGPLASTALSYRGVHYRSGGNDPEGGFDCSGFVWYVFARHGISVPRTVAEQYQVGMSVDSADIRAGDLVFFNTTGVTPSHVGISIGGDAFVHAPNAAGEVRVERIGARYWSERFVGIRRVD
jgi:cell wall-associated NlpC family hydrolase